MRLFQYLCALVACGIFLGFLPAKAQPGPNRFQYHKFYWQVLSTETAQLYYPDGYDSLARFTSIHLPLVKAALSEAMDSPTFPDKPNIILYPALDQLYESNVGLYEPDIQRFPTLSLNGSRMLLAFNGSYEAFLRQLHVAYAALAWENLFPQELDEQATGARQLIPDWFKEGAIRYFGETWPLGREQQLAELILMHKPENWQALSNLDQGLSGQAFCYFLGRQYRERAGKHVLFQLKSGKSLARAVRLVTKRTLEQLTQECFDFYVLRFQAIKREDPDTLLRQLRLQYPKEQLSQLRISPDGKKVVYVAEKSDIRTVYLHTLPIESGRGIRLTRYALPPWIGAQAPDAYPIIAWTEAGESLWIAAPHKGKIRVNSFRSNGNPGAFRTLYGVDGVSTIIIPQRGQWWLSAFRRGKSDIVVYDPRRLRFTPLTDDLADHIDLSYYARGDLKRIAYRSGFPTDSLYYPDSTTKAYGIYSKDLLSDLKNAAKLNDRLLLPDSGGIHWRDPSLLPEGGLSVGGRGNRDTFTLTHTGDLGQQHATRPSPFSAWMREHRQRQQAKDSLDRLLHQLKENDPSPLRAIFQAAGNDPKKQDSGNAAAYRADAITPYQLQLHQTYFSLQVNNDYFINRYQPFQAYLGSFKFPEVGVMAQGGLSDLFENHHINLGYRMPTANAGSDFFFRYKNTARNLDWHVQFFRKVESLAPDPLRDWETPDGRRYPTAAKVKTHYYELGFHYPLTYDLSLDYLVAARNDRTVFLATSKYSLKFEDLRQWWNIHSLSISRNRLQKQKDVPFMYRGWQARLLADGMLALKRPSTILGGLQALVEYHQPLGKALNLVARAQAGISGGQSHIMYNFGGVDNNVILHTDTAIRFAQQAPYAFLSLVTPFRGYPQSSLYGSGFGLLNLDLYIPLFTSLIPLHTAFTSFNQLQLGAFSDMAMAREPYGVSRTLISWGFSARTMLAGYPIRIEVAWPGDFSKKPVWYLSLRL